MKILKIAFSEINNVYVNKESQLYPIDTSLPITRYKFWNLWIIMKLKNAGFDLNKPLYREDSFETKEMIYKQEDGGDLNDKN